MQEPLYLDDTVEIEKLGNEARLSENSDTWIHEVHDELMKQHPYLGEYETFPTITESDGDKGYALGFFLVRSRTAKPSVGPGTEALNTIHGARECRIPIIIKERILKPLDVFINNDGESYPLNRTRVQAAMYRYSLFEGTGQSPKDVSLTNYLYPPGAQSRSAGNVYRDEPYYKYAAVRPEHILEAIAPTISKDDISKIEATLEKDASLMNALVSNDASRAALEYLSTLNPTTADDVAKIASQNIPPDVMQLTRHGESYILKMANSQMFSPEELEVDRPTAVELTNEDVVKDTDEYGAVTVSTDPVVHDSVEDEEIAPIERFGEYRVKTVNGQEIMGWVFPLVLDFDGTALPMKIFTNGSVSAIQEKIVGSLVGKSSNIIRGEPKGYGFFYRVTASGGVIAFVPTEVVTRADDNGTLFVCHSMMAEVRHVRPTPGMEGIVEIGDPDSEVREFAIPGDVRWAPLGDEATALVSDADVFTKTSALKGRESTVEIISDRDTWSFRGGAGVEKLAHSWRNGLEGDQAMFVACLLGMSPTLAANSLIKAAKHQSVTVAGCRTIRSPGEKLNEMRKEAKSLFDELPKRCLLLKEAAVFEDMTTVDKVLSLGFINPENVQVFISYLPEFDTTVKKLALLLTAARVGLEDIPENAVKSAMERLEETLSGLKKLVLSQERA